MKTETRYPSKSQPDLEYFVEPFEGSFMVVAQVVGFPATEAFDDWFANREDAEDIAKRLAAGEQL